MQPQIAPAHAGKIALRTGASVGILLGIIHSIITIISTIQSADKGGNGVFLTTLLYLITPLVWIVGLLFAGTWSSKFTGKVSTGTQAGLFAGLFGGLVASFGQAIASAISVNFAPDSSSILITGFAAIFYILVLAIGAGAGCGALGGLIGQAVSDVRPPAPQPAHIPVYQPPVVPYGYMPQPHPLPQTPLSPIMSEVPSRKPEQ